MARAVLSAVAVVVAVFTPRVPLPGLVPTRGAISDSLSPPVQARMAIATATAFSTATTTAPRSRTPISATRMGTGLATCRPER